MYTRVICRNWILDGMFAGAGYTFGIFCVINLVIWALAGFLGVSATSLAMRTFRYSKILLYLNVAARRSAQSVAELLVILLCAWWYKPISMQMAHMQDHMDRDALCCSAFAQLHKCCCVLCRSNLICCCPCITGSHSRKHFRLQLTGASQLLFNLFLQASWLAVFAMQGHNTKFGWWCANGSTSTKIRGLISTDTTRCDTRSDDHEVCKPTKSA